MGFADSVGKTVDKMQAEVNAKGVEISMVLFKSVVDKTPVGQRLTRGRLINNWYIGQGKGKYNRTYKPFSNPSGANSYAQITYLKDSKEFLGKDGEISFTNSTPYGYRAEFFGWNFSGDEPRWRHRTPPYAMIARSLAEVAPQYRKN